MHNSNALHEAIGGILSFYELMGGVDAIEETPRDWSLPTPKLLDAVRAQKPAQSAPSSTMLRRSNSSLPPSVRPKPRVPQASQMPAQQEVARTLASDAQSVEALRMAVTHYTGCNLKAMAKNTVFSDGNSEAKIMLIGEAPGSDEDRIGKPFVGVSGQLLDRMLSYIGLTRDKNFYITNMVFWRPPGNRTPTADELALCEPFTRKHIALVKPKILVFVGGLAAKTLLGTSEGITRMRGRWRRYCDTDYGLDIPAMPMLHPAYLLRQPKAKQQSWEDCLNIMQEARKLDILEES